MTPFLTAGIAWLAIGEREDRATLAATLVGGAIVLSAVLADMALHARGHAVGSL